MSISAAASSLFVAVCASLSLALPVFAQPSKEWKLIEARTGKELRWRDLPGRLASANVIFLGEQHDDPETHRAETAILNEAFKKFGARLTLAMEMFERDGQSGLDDYLAGKTDETAFAKNVRLWPNYPTDYRPLIEYAKINKIPVLGSNAPQKIVRRIGKDGLSATFAALAPEEKGFVAAFITAPDGDAYAARFAGIISEGHGDGTTMEPAMIRRFYEAQCARDDTMAETIARALDSDRIVLHINGSFHSDAGLGTAARVRWRQPLNARIALLKIVPYTDKIDSQALRGEADYLLFVPDRRPQQSLPKTASAPRRTKT